MWLELGECQRWLWAILVCVITPFPLSVTVYNTNTTWSFVNGSFVKHRI